MRGVELALALSLSGCGIAFPLHCFDGECLPEKDGGTGMPDVAMPKMETGVQDAPIDTSVDAADAKPDVVVNPCLVMPDPCRNVVMPNGGCYCGTNTTGNFDHNTAVPGCLYQCNDSKTPGFTQGAKMCPNGCSIEPSGVMDNCTGTAPTDYAHCLD